MRKPLKETDLLLNDAETIMKYEDFVGYVMSFYGKRPGSVYPEFNFTLSEVRKALLFILNSSLYPSFSGDSFDREHVRNIILNDRLIEDPNERWLR
jgi:hypothetical protein|tara:strand:+ start:501 stop:788 length:288 start_codon:yes stop_codon:yes gene_type:complete